MQRDTIFVSYSRADSSGRDALVKHLEVVLGKPPRVRIFADTSIETGEEWRNRIRDEMDRALVVVLLVSADFLTSEFVQSVEIPRAALAARRGEAVIACLYVRHCAANVFHIHVDDPNGEGFDIRVTDYQGLNAPNSPLMARKGAKREQLLAQAAGEIVELAEARLKEATRQQEAEAKLKAEEATRQREAEAKRKAEEATRQREAEAKREAEEATRQREAEAKRKAEEATRQREAEAKRKAEEATRQREAEAKRRAEEATRQQEAEAKRKAEEERRQREAEAKHKAEEERRQREAEAKRKAEARQLEQAREERRAHERKQDAELKTQSQRIIHWMKRRWYLIAGMGLLFFIVILVPVLFSVQDGRRALEKAPEAHKEFETRIRDGGIVGPPIEERREVETRTPEGRTTESRLVALDIKLPKPMFVGTPQDANVLNLETPLGKARPPFLAPEGTRNVALGKPVTSSDEEPIIGEIDYITDGDKEGDDGCYVELGPFTQHVTVDLEAMHEIYAVVIWHYHKQPRVYFDVVAQVTDDPDFITNVRTLFNNDIDNSSGLGPGKDMHYTETYEGKLIDAGGLVARYVRLYSNGNTGNDLNHYIEVEVYGKAKPGGK